MPLPIPIVGGLINAGSSIIDSVAQGFTNRANRKFAEKMYDKQRADALADTAAQNAYNDPSAQMARLKKAGLNPNLVYGSGQATEPSASTRASSVTQGNAQYRPVNLGDSISTYIQMKRADSEIDLQKTQQMLNLVHAVLGQSQRENVEANTANTQAETELRKFDLGFKTEMRETSKEAAVAALNKQLADTQFTIDQNARANALLNPTISKMILEQAQIMINNARTAAEIKEIRARTNNILADTRLKNADADLKDKGIQPHDSALSRWIQAQLAPGKEYIPEEDFKKLPKALQFWFNPPKK